MTNGGPAVDLFQNKVAAVTGGASGIGQALCEKLARRGAAVVVADIDSQRAQHVASAIAVALQALAVEGKQEEAKAILQEELQESPTDEDLLKLLRTLNDSSQ